MAAVNNNSSTVIIGRTAPVPAGQQNSAKSIPVVIASDQTAIPVEEQNKQQSEVALSLLGIPRSEVALGIFADVNTYDVNPTEWSAFPEQFTTLDQYKSDGSTPQEKYVGYGGDQDWGLTHISEEAGAMIEAPADEYSILTSKRFFRYQPGRVSAATFGVKLNRAVYTITKDDPSNSAIRNPAIKKYGIFDKFDGYYFESRNDGYGDNFTVVRRTQSIIRDNPLPFSINAKYQQQDYAWVGVPLVESSAPKYPNAFQILTANKRYLQEVAAQNLVGLDGPDDGTGDTEDQKCRRDAGLVIEGILHDLKYGGNASTVYNTYRFFNTNDLDNITLYVDSPAVEVTRYNTILSAIQTIFSGSTPVGSPLNGIAAYAAGSGTLPSAESSAGDAVASLIGILTTALTGSGNYSSIPNPSGSAAGEMCVYRDGLIMTHAAAHDPSLLKEKTSYEVTALNDDGTSKWLRFKIPAGKEALQVGQGFYFNKNGSDNNIVSTQNQNLKDGSIWHVYEVGGIISNSTGVYQDIKLSKYPNNEEIYTSVGGGSTSNPSNPWGNNADKAYTDVEEFVISSAADIGTSGYTLQTPVPFLLPADNRKYKGQNYSDGSLNDLSPQYVDGAFPYLYPSGASNDPNSVGYIDTTLDGSSGIPTLKQQINYVNKRLYKNWVWFNVDPKYYKVYEYRIPRSRMSGEKLNGVTSDLVYSDNVLDFKAGDPVEDPTTQEQIEVESVWDLDPTKVTMYKIEFSWYGAVGATFLAYVPVSNGEARWVRVHHLRASNQLKVASLGNATLPITYMVYGGGSTNRYGYDNADRLSNTASGYGSFSEQLVKYGASYYIDGGDRGTVRLFSYASETLKEIGGSKYLIQVSSNPNLFDNAATQLLPSPGTTYVNAPALTIVNTNGAPDLSDYYINARVITGNANDQDIRVIWVDSSANRLYLSRGLSATTGDISLVVDRPQPLVGIKCRTEINGVRNRVQIYPTRLATGLTSTSESLVVQLIKSPLFQTFDVPASGASLGVNTAINIGKRGKKILLPSAEITESGTYLSEGQKTYGYFRYTVVGDTSGAAATMLGLLQKENGNYFFSASEVTIDDLNIRGSFLRVGNYSGPVNPADNEGDGSDLSGTVEAPGFNGFFSSSLSRLSAVNIDTEQRSPIPGTGTVVTTLFAPNSGAEFNLQSYFDYNKDYLSFPLTDLVDSLYICASSKSFFKDGNGTGSYGKRGEILASITWEEQ
jgi:hypothetical protein